MKERPILFSGEMVRATLDGRKTKTRRVIKCKPSIENHWVEKLDGEEIEMHDAKQDSYGLFEKYSVGDYGGAPYEVEISDIFQCPYGQPGDRLWVRENFKIKNFLDADISNTENGYECNAEAEATVLYTDGTERRVVGLVDNEGVKYDIDEIAQAENFSKKKCWNPSIHMPRWASRIILEIVSVRVERLQDITEEDAKAEGVSQLFDEKTKMSRPECNFDSWTNYLWHGNWGQCGMGNKKSDAWQYQYSGYEKARDSFSSLWESINGPGSWEANPWVWVIEFKRVKP